jgi:glycosyltransferase involved in cell wall biosynthesis
MKILMLARALPAHRKGGVPDHTWMLARGLASRGVGVHVMTTRIGNGPGVSVREGVTVHALANTRPDSYGGGWWSESARCTIALQGAERFDLIHCQSSAGYGVVNAGIHRRLRIPAVVSQHGTYYDELLTRWRNGFSADPVRCAKNLAAIAWIVPTLLVRDRPYLRAASGVVSTSDEQYDLISRVYGIPEERLHKVYNGMDLTLFTPGPGSMQLRERHGVDASAPVILCVARMIRDKGIQNIVNAMPLILGRIAGARLLVVGDGPYRPELERLVSRRGVSRQVVFAGERGLEELPEYFRTCDVFVNATNQQNGYDLTMVEAMACARTVVSSDIGSTPTLIAGDVDGLLVPTGDVRALADAVAALLGDAARRRQMGERARAKVTGRFDLDTMVRGTIGVYEHHLGRTPGGQDRGRTS